MTDNAPLNLQVIQGGAQPGAPANTFGGFVRPDRQFIDDFVVPYGYELWGDGLYKLDPQAIAQAMAAANPDPNVAAALGFDQDDADADDGDDDADDADSAPAFTLDEGLPQQVVDTRHLRTPTPAYRQTFGLIRIAYRPIWISRCGMSLDTDQAIIELAYVDAAQRECRLWTDRAQLTDRTKVARLGGEGLPIHTENSSAVLLYLEAAYMENSMHLPHTYVGSRMGAYFLPSEDENPAPTAATATATATAQQKGPRIERLGWLFGDRWYGPPDTHVERDVRHDSELSQALRAPAGTLAEWKEQMARISRCGPITRWIVASAFVAPLLRLVGKRTFVLYQHGHTGHGKTSLHQFALSAWGDPSRLKMTLSDTQVSVTGAFQYASDLPMLWDDLQSDRTGKAYDRLIYEVCAERGKARTSKDGTRTYRVVKEWRALVLLNGEEPILGKGGEVDLGGQANRVLEMGEPAFPTQDAAKQLYDWLQTEACWGTAGPYFLEWLRDFVVEEGVESIRQRFEEIRTTLSEQAEGRSARVDHIAVIALAQALAFSCLFDIDVSNAQAGAVQDAVHVARAICLGETEVVASPADQAIQIFADAIEEERQRFIDLSSPNGRDILVEGRYRQLWGVLAGDEVWLLYSPAKELLRRNKLPPERIWNDFRRSGVMISADAGRTTCTRAVGAFRKRVIVLRRDALFPPDPTGFVPPAFPGAALVDALPGNVEFLPPISFDDAVVVD